MYVVRLSGHTIDSSSAVLVIDRNEASAASTYGGIDLVGGSRITANFVLSKSSTSFMIIAVE
jgi:hypothetical protein